MLVEFLVKLNIGTGEPSQKLGLPATSEEE
jgi:hypothetical protein